jgi:hypothetical protein
MTEPVYRTALVSFSLHAGHGIDQWIQTADQRPHFKLQRTAASSEEDAVAIRLLLENTASPIQAEDMLLPWRVIHRSDVCRVRRLPELEKIHPRCIGSDTV